jgi:hypothetical protein
MATQRFLALQTVSVPHTQLSFKPSTQDTFRCLPWEETRFSARRSARRFGRFNRNRRSDEPHRPTHHPHQQNYEQCTRQDQRSAKQAATDNPRNF